MATCVNCGRPLSPGDPPLYEFDPDDPEVTIGPFDPICFDADAEGRAQRAADYAAVQQAQDEYTRAIGLNAAPTELAALQEATLADEGIQPGDPWRQPTGAHDAYPLDAKVTHEGKTWRSTIAANVWEPGVAGWVEEGTGIPAWVQPTGSADAYPLGAVVSHVGKVWKSDLNANVWEPGVYGWTAVLEPAQH
jgi:hypothetical protein